MAPTYSGAHRVSQVCPRWEVHLLRCRPNRCGGGDPDRSSYRTPRADCALGFQAARGPKLERLVGLDGELGTTGGPRPQFDTGLPLRPGPLTGPRSGAKWERRGLHRAGTGACDIQPPASLSRSCQEKQGVLALRNLARNGIRKIGWSLTA